MIAARGARVAAYEPTFGKLPRQLVASAGRSGSGAGIAGRGLRIDLELALELASEFEVDFDFELAFELAFEFEFEFVLETGVESGFEFEIKLAGTA